MPLYQLYFRNSATPPADQDWILGGVIGQEFTLKPNQHGGGQLNINSDGAIQISVSTDFFAAAVLAYTAATDTWDLSSPTPNQFQLGVFDAQVKVECFLNDQNQNSGVRPEYVGEQPSFDPA
jgi:hypothetical protein